MRYWISETVPVSFLNCMFFSKQLSFSTELQCPWGQGHIFVNMKYTLEHNQGCHLLSRKDFITLSHSASVCTVFCFHPWVPWQILKHRPFSNCALFSSADWWTTSSPGKSWKKPSCSFFYPNYVLERNGSSRIFLYSPQRQGETEKLERGPVFPVYISSDPLGPQNYIFYLLDHRLNE